MLVLVVEQDVFFPNAVYIQREQGSEKSLPPLSNRLGNCTLPRGLYLRLQPPVHRHHDAGRKQRGRRGGEEKLLRGPMQTHQDSAYHRADYRPDAPHAQSRADARGS